MDLQELTQLVESGQHGVPFDVKVFEADLAKFANERAGGFAADVSVDISPPSVTVGAKTKVAALPMNVLISGKPLLEDGRLKFDVDTVEVNKRPAPDFIRSQIIMAINEKLDPAELPVEVTRMDLGDGWVEIVGETK